MQGQAGIDYIPAEDRLVLSGGWDTCRLDGLDRRLEALQAELPASGAMRVDGARLERLDTAGALLLQRFLDGCRGRGLDCRLEGLSETHRGLLELVRRRCPREPLERAPVEPALAALGRSVWTGVGEFGHLLGFLGQLTGRLAATLIHPGRFRARAFLKELYAGGVAALPIVGLLSLLIGVVVAYQGAVQLRRYGADIFIVDLVTLSSVRELAPLIAAIIVAGRTGSAYAAQIGTMVVTEEVNALRTIGIPPMDLLVLPKLLALFLALPLLTLFADLASVLGGMFMAEALLDIDPRVFVERIPQAVSERSYLLGLSKAPVFAGIIAVVGCFQGFRVAGGADAVGRRTTVAVVHSIFLVILTDGLFSVLFSWLGI